MIKIIFLKRSFINLFFMMFFLGLFFNSVYASSNISIWFEEGTKKVFQEDFPKSLNSFEIYSAKNEFEPVQLVINSNETLENIDVDFGLFVGPDVIDLNLSTINLVGYLNITNPSNLGVKLGMWPDIIIPKVDSYYREKRNTFPIVVKPNINSVILFDFFIPNSTKPGKYISIINITQNGILIGQKQVNLTVWNFSLPSKPTLVFASDFGGLEGAHYGNFWSYTGADKPLYQVSIDLFRDYMKAGLKNKIELAPLKPSFSGWNGTEYTSIGTMYSGGTSQDFYSNENNILGIEYGASKLTSSSYRFDKEYRVYANCSDPNATLPKEELFLKAESILRYFNNTIPLDNRENVFFLTLDEAGGGEVGCGYLNPTMDFNTVKKLSNLIHKYGFKVEATNRIRDELLNSSNNPPTNDYIDLWTVPHSGFVGYSWDGSHIDNTNLYKEPLLNGAQVWWYSGCGTHWCGAVGNLDCLRNMQYIVEYPSMHLRIMPWLNFKYNITGILYYGTTLNFNAQNKDPWNSLWSTYKGNGDGDLLYPGVPNTTKVGLPYGTRGLHTPSIGGEHHIPIDSFRLKIIRESMEDYEYLYLLQELNNRDYGLEEVGLLANHTYDFEKNISKLYEVRKDLGNEIERLMGSFYIRNKNILVKNNVSKLNFDFSTEGNLSLNISGPNFNRTYLFNNNLNNYVLNLENLSSNSVYTYNLKFCNSENCEIFGPFYFKTKKFFIEYNNSYWNNIINFNDLDENQFSNISNVNFKTNYGEIIYLNPLKINRSLNLINNIVIEDKRIYVNSNVIPEFNRSAQLIFYNLNLINPLILKNDNICLDCNIISYINGTLIFNVTSFSEYEVIDNLFCGDNICNNGETCNICSLDCGTCSTNSSTNSSSSSGSSSGGSSSSSSSSSKGSGGGGGGFREIINNIFSPIKKINCIEDWVCLDWSQCSNLTKSRDCYENNNCLNITKRKETINCVAKPEVIIYEDFNNEDLVQSGELEYNDVNLNKTKNNIFRFLGFEFNYLSITLIIGLLFIISLILFIIRFHKRRYYFNKHFLNEYRNKLKELSYSRDELKNYENSIYKLSKYINDNQFKDFEILKKELIDRGWSYHFIENALIKRKK